MGLAAKVAKKFRCIRFLCNANDRVAGWEVGVT